MTKLSSILFSGFISFYLFYTHIPNLIFSLFQHWQSTIPTDVSFRFLNFLLVISLILLSRLNDLCSGYIFLTIERILESLLPVFFIELFYVKCFGCCWFLHGSLFRLSSTSVRKTFFHVLK